MSRGSGLNHGGDDGSPISLDLEGDIARYATNLDEARTAWQEVVVAYNVVDSELESTIIPGLNGMYSDLITYTASLADYVDPGSEDYIGLNDTVTKFGINLSALTSGVFREIDMEMDVQALNDDSAAIRIFAVTLGTVSEDALTIAILIKDKTTQIDAEMEIFLVKALLRYELDLKRKMLLQEIKKIQVALADFESKDY